MTQDSSKPEPQDLDLGDTIDALLGEIDASCAHYDDKPEPETNNSGLISDTGTQPEAPTPTPENDALEALDEVSQIAETLLDESIGELLDQAPPAADTDTEAATPDTADPTDSTAPTEPTDTTDAPAPESAPETTPVSAEESADTSEQTQTPEPEAQQQDSETETSPDAQADEAPQELIESVNEELATEPSEDQPAPESESEPKPEPEPDPEPVQAVEEDAVAPAAEPEADTEPAPEAEAKAEPVAETEAVPEPKAEPVAETETAPDSETQAQDTDDQLETLDDALAGKGDELMAGDFENADGETVDSQALEDSIDPAMLLDQLDIPNGNPEPAQTESDQTAPAQPAAAQPESDAPEPQPTTADIADATAPQSPTPEPTPDPAQPKAKEPAFQAHVPEEIIDTTDSTDEPLTAPQVSSIWETLFRVSKAKSIQFVAFAKVQAAPIAAKTILALSKPLSTKPTHVRDSIGYLAIWTLFLAAVLWIYVMFFRAPPSPIIPSQAPSRVVTPQDNLEPIENHMKTQPGQP